MFSEQSLALISNNLAGWKIWAISMLPNFVAAILVLLLFGLLARTLRRASILFYQRFFPKNQRLAQLFSMAVFSFIWFMGILLALEILHLASFLTHLLAGAGIVGIIAGFAFKDIASNAFSGLLIKSEQPFKIHDWVNIKGTIGKVRNVGLVTVSLETLEGETALIPNQLIYSGEFFNYSNLKKKRVVIRSGVSYGDDLEKVKSTALALANRWDFVINKKDIHFYFTDIGSSTFNFMLDFWADFNGYEEYLEIKSQAIMQLKRCFDEQNISLAYNVTTLDFGVKGGVNLFDQTIKVETLTSNHQNDKTE
ncbi:small conductance mechanosensitive channel [Volucribacter psittacicida]|uniref:Small-conductance mechanosensitive channel n=1 Tax=Volucribacter psittacicida TaxID=203482 RepID=A0A4R1FRW3_9PAST|nr:mechanosensitive ion channel family protein [Volucribacter psittacicida]TCJ96219.1 small conductance mechanosensitive channel [Volucribacter psittacicida]